MAYTNKRVGISYISDKENLDTIYNEEIIVDKVTGEVLVKTPTLGNVISYNYHTRFNNHIQKLISDSTLHGILRGVIVEITPDDMSLPTVNNMLNINLMGDDGYSAGFGASNVFISVDLDCIKVSDTKISMETAINTPIEYEISSYHIGKIARTYSGTTTLGELNEMSFSFPEKNSDIVISKLIIGENPSSDISRYILHSICVHIQKNGMYAIRSISIVQQHTNEQHLDQEFDPTGLIVQGVDSIGQTVTLDEYDINIEYIDG